MRIALALLALPLLATSASADDGIAKSATLPRYELGIRVGGYGFRRDGGQEWDECRMSGFGVVGTRDVRGPVFVEAGIDYYATVPVENPDDLPIDRQSGLFSSAIGLRMQLASWLRGYVQLGGGLEITRVSVPYGDKRIRDTKALPEGFFGVGLDLRLWRATYFGTSFRTLVMGNFDYDPARLDPGNMWVAQPTAETVFAASPDIAAQVQFSLRHEL